MVESFGNTSGTDMDKSLREKMKATNSQSSFLSWETVDIEEERASNSRSNKFFLAGSIFVNVMLNIWLLVIYVNIRD